MNQQCVKLGVVLLACDPSIWEIETGWLEIQSRSGPCNGFKASPGYIYIKYVFAQEYT